MTHRIAAVQMNSGAEVAGNLERAAHWISRAAGLGAQAVVLPENFALMPRNDADRLHAAERDGAGPIQDFLADQAQARGVWLVGGTIPLFGRAADRYFASCLVYDPAGRRVARYDKIHLFDVAVSETEAYRESEFIEPGAAADPNLVCVDMPFGRVGLTVCYDLRFPELFRTLTARGVVLFTVPSAFTATTGRAHWETLLRARAIENLAFVVAPAQSGTHINGRETFGHSMIIDPWGRVIGRLGDEREGVTLAELDLDSLQGVRKRFPTLQHRRL